MLKLVFRRGTAQELNSINPILARNEIVRESDTGRWKIGTELIAHWNDLPYQPGDIPEWIFLREIGISWLRRLTRRFLAAVQDSVVERK